jgi:uncharacterized membrane protein
MRTRSAGHSVFAVTLIGIGLLGLIDAVSHPVSQGLSAVEVLAYLRAFTYVACGIGLLFARIATAAARVLFVYFLLLLLVFRAPGLLHGFGVDVYWSLCETAVMLAAAWVLYASLATDWDRQRFGFVVGDKGLHIARALYGAAVIPFGIAHFQYLKHTASMVPNWLPAHVAWAYFTGAAFIVAGVAILIGVWARLAAALSTLQMGLFLALVWVPAVTTRSLNAFQRGEVLTTWVLTAAAWVVTDSYRGIPWLASGHALAGAQQPSDSSPSLIADKPA